MGLFVCRTKYLLLRCVGVLRGSAYVLEESCLVMVCLHVCVCVYNETILCLGFYVREVCLFIGVMHFAW